MSRVRYVRAVGAPIAEEDAPVIGRELHKIAAEKGTGDLRSLTGEEVFEVVYNDKRHPLRYLFGDFADTEAAARKHWIGLASGLIRSIRVVSLPARPRAPVQPMFLCAEVPGEGSAPVRRHVLREDAVQNISVLESAVRMHVARVESAVRSLELLAGEQGAGKDAAALCKALRAALEGYRSRRDAAAE